MIEIRDQLDLEGGAPVVQMLVNWIPFLCNLACTPFYVLFPFMLNALGVNGMGSIPPFVAIPHTCLDRSCNNNTSPRHCGRRRESDACTHSIAHACIQATFCTTLFQTTSTFTTDPGSFYKRAQTIPTCMDPRTNLGPSKTPRILRSQNDFPCQSS